MLFSFVPSLDYGGQLHPLILCLELNYVVREWSIPSMLFYPHSLSEDKPLLPILTYTPDFKAFSKTGLLDKDKNFALPLTSA